MATLRHIDSPYAMESTQTEQRAMSRLNGASPADEPSSPTLRDSRAAGALLQRDAAGGRCFSRPWGPRGSRALSPFGEPNRDTIGNFPFPHMSASPDLAESNHIDDPCHDVVLCCCSPHWLAFAFEAPFRRPGPRTGAMMVVVPEERASCAFRGLTLAGVRFTQTSGSQKAPMASCRCCLSASAISRTRGRDIELDVAPTTIATLSSASRRVAVLENVELFKLDAGSRTTSQLFKTSSAFLSTELSPRPTRAIHPQHLLSQPPAPPGAQRGKSITTLRSPGAAMVNWVPGRAIAGAAAVTRGR